MEPVTQSTTSDALYKVVLEDKLNNYLQFVERDLSAFEVPAYTYTGDLKGLIDYRDRLGKMCEESSQYVVPAINIDIPAMIRERYGSQLLEYSLESQTLETEINAMYERRKSDYRSECESIRNSAEASISGIKRKHDELLSYKDKLKSTITRYGITPADTKISTDISKEEFEALVDTALSVCRHESGKLDKLMKLVKEPLSGDTVSVVVYCIALLLGAWLFLPLVSVVYIVILLKNTKNMYANIDKLKIAELLMYSVDFDRFIESEKYTLPAFDVTELDAEAQQKRDELAKRNPENDIAREVAKFRCDAGITYMSKRLAEVKSGVNERYQALRQALSNKYEEVCKLLEKEMTNIKGLGETINDSTVMDTNYIIGTQSGIPVKRDFTLTNINYVGKYSDKMLEFLKIMFVNALMSVRANNMEITIFDPDYLGQAFSEFIVPETSDIIKINRGQFSSVQEEMQKRASENILAIKTDTILDFNKKSEELGMVTRQYYLYIFLTGLDDKLLENKPFLEFVKFSAKQGVIVWTVYDKEIPNTTNLRVPIQGIDGELLKYDYGIGSKAVSTYLYALENSKRPALDYRKGYLLKYLPPENWWKANSIKGLNIRLGLVDGDPSKAYLHYFNDANVHFLLGGATGAGKSVTIDCTMQNLIHEYSPEELQLVYIDMKNAEVAKYTKDGISCIPHAIVVAGTTDGEYCLSVFDWALDEMLRRMGICRKYGVQKVEDLRKKFDNPRLENYDPEVHIPRIVILVDEFQVMFDSSRLSPKIISKIEGRIGSLVKLARAASIHLWFTSQEMSGTLSKNMLDNFSLRGALRCTRAISSTLIGNEAAGRDIKEKVGWMFSNDTAGQDEKANKMWRVPYAPVDDLMRGIDELQEKCKRENKLCLKAKFYDEKQGVTAEDLKQAYSEEPEFKNAHYFVLGARTVYSTKTTPLNFRIVEDNKENIIIGASERQDLLDLIGTCIDNIRYSDNASILINSSDKDSIYLLNLEQYQPEGWEDFLSPMYDVKSIIDDLDEIATSREELESLEDTPVLYVLCIAWERLEGVGVDEKYQNTDALAKLIARLNAVKVHFIFFVRDKGIPMTILSTCNHKICAKADEKLAIQLTGDMIPFKFPSPFRNEACFALYVRGSDCSKFKIYRHELKRQLEEREL